MMTTSLGIVRATTVTEPAPVRETEPKQPPATKPTPPSDPGLSPFERPPGIKPGEKTTPKA